MPIPILSFAALAFLGLDASRAPLPSKGVLTDDRPYLAAIAVGAMVLPLMTVGETVKRTSNPAQGYRMAGIPDGLGAYAAGDGTLQIFMNHELRKTAVTHPAGSPARIGAFISRYALSRPEAGVISGDFAYSAVSVGDGPADTAGAFSRLCSGNLAGPEVGLTEPIYFTGEEDPSGGFAGKGGEAVAVVEGRARLLPDFGRMSYENLIVAPTPVPSATVVFSLEDGPADSCELYMYVGAKRDGAAGILARNGLLGGRMYAFKSSDASKRDEAAFSKGVLAGTWVEIAGAGNKTASRWESDTRAAGAFIFDRIEDGTYDRNRKGVFYFVTTGGTARNPHGRLYKLAFDAANPAAGAASLEILKVGGPGSFASPDNIDANADGQILIAEDPVDSSYALLRGEKRNAGVWLFDTGTGSLTRVAGIDEGAVPPRHRNFGDTWWETTGILDASAWYGRGAWLLNVQAHSVLDPEAGRLQGLAAGVKVDQGGQLLLLKLK